MSDLGGRTPDRQAEMEIRARTKPAAGKGARDEDEGADGEAVRTENGKGAGKAGRSTGGRDRKKKVTNPDLERIMERLDAELLD